MHVIDSNSPERDAGGKPVPTFPHPAPVIAAVLAPAILWSVPAHASIAVSDLVAVLEAAAYPLTLAEDVMALLALGLVGGMAGRVPWKRDLPVFLLGLLTACGLLVTVPLPTLLWLLALLLALWLGLIAAADLDLPPWVSAALAAAAGFSVGLDAVPVARTSVLTLAAVVTGSALLSATLWLAVAAVVARSRRPWQRIGARIVGSWLAAISALLRALAIAAQPAGPIVLATPETQIDVGSTGLGQVTVIRAASRRSSSSGGSLRGQISPTPSSW